MSFSLTKPFSISSVNSTNLSILPQLNNQSHIKDLTKLFSKELFGIALSSGFCRDVLDSRRLFLFHSSILSFNIFTKNCEYFLVLLVSNFANISPIDIFKNSFSFFNLLIPIFFFFIFF